jgi:hypothetical protein|eukprot:COSAG03_NODE_557_length_6952_cov_2.339559_6_plen_105_part_00
MVCGSDKHVGVFTSQRLHGSLKAQLLNVSHRVSCVSRKRVPHISSCMSVVAHYATVLSGNSSMHSLRTESFDILLCEIPQVAWHGIPAKHSAAGCQSLSCRKMT